MKNKLIHSGFIYTLGNLLSQGISFLTLPLYIRMMSVSDYGDFSLFASWAALVTIVFSLQISGSFSIAKVKYAEDFESYVSTSVFLTISSSLLFGLLVLFYRQRIINFFHLDNIVLLFLLLQALIGALQSCLNQYLIQRQKSVIHLIVNLSYSILHTGLTLFLLTAMKNGFHARVYGNLLTGFLFSAAFIIYLFVSTRKHFAKKYVRFILLTSLPLIFHLLAHQLLSQADRIMIVAAQGKEAVAVYSFAYTVATILQIVFASLSTAWTPWYFEQKRARKEAEIQRAKKFYILLVTFLSIGFLSVAPDFIDILGKGVYSQHKEIVLIVALGHYIGFLYTFPVNIQFYHGETKLIPVGTVIAAVLNIVLNYFLIAVFAITGAALATLLSYFALWAFHQFITYKRYRNNEVSTVKCFLLFAAVALYGLYVWYFMDSLFARWLSCALIFLCLAARYGKEILHGGNTYD